MKKILYILFILFSVSVSVSAQQQIKKYYDNKWKPCAKENAEYYAIFTKTDSLYQCNSYFADKDILRGKSTFPDTLMSYPIGEQILYFKNGKVEDSGYYSNNGYTIERSIYYPNGQLGLRYKKNSADSKELIDAYESDGKRIKNYIYEKEADFKGGFEAWKKYLTKNVGTFYSPDETTKIVEVRVQFVINTQGFATQAKIIKSSSITAIDNDAKRLILQSPQWENAIQYNRPVIAYRIAPISYELVPLIKKKN